MSDAAHHPAGSAAASADASAPSSSAPPPSPAAGGASVSNGSGVPPHVMAAIYGTKSAEEKKAELEKSLNRWWEEYADRKNDEDHEYVANSLLYDKRQLPRTAPAPECVAPPARQVPQLQQAQQQAQQHAQQQQAVQPAQPPGPAS